MTTTLTLPDDLMRQIELLAASEGSDLNEAIAHLLAIGLASATENKTEPQESMLNQRRALTQKFLSGEWGLELASFEEARANDRRKEAERAKTWKE